MPLKLAVRGIVTWIIESLALLALTRVLPGVRVSDWQMGAIAVLAIGALNALVRPLVVLFAINLGVLPFAILALLLNALLVLVASWLVPGFSVDTLWTAFLVALGLAVLNALLSGLLGINDDDSFYRNVVRWLERRRAPAPSDTRGTILLQIDGLAYGVLEDELRTGGLPTLARWLSDGSHRLIRWECGVPSMTSSSQAGILYGNNADIPAFRWYDKQRARLLVSNHPRDAHLIDQRQATDHGLLRLSGSSVGNIFAGGADHCVMTMSRLTSDSGGLAARTTDLRDYFINPYNLYRAIGAMAWELVVEYLEAWRQRLQKVRPRMHRGGSYPIVRAVTCVLLRDITTWMLVADMFAGRRVSYADYLGYDEVAHHAGPSTDDARRVLRKMEGQLHQLETAARIGARQYQFVVLSDHGQSTGATFRQRYGVTLDQLVHRLMESGEDVKLASGRGEGQGQVHALLSDVAGVAGAIGGAARRLAHLELVSPPGPTEHVETADVVVCASGNLGLVYFARTPGRLSLEQIDASYPRLVEGLVAHPGVGFVLAHSDAHGPVVLGHTGRRDLRDDRIVGDDPLAAFSPHTAAFLRRLSTFGDVGDLVVNSTFDVETGEVAAFEELIGCHGGAGGLQTAPFVVYPADWGEPEDPIVGAEALHQFLRKHI
jgi:uncharacterized membrane protein YvlD (DUF360 family)